MNKLKIALVGPVKPFRGGIAQYTEALHHSLGLLADTSVMSFKRLYPSFLYPGDSDNVAGYTVAEQSNTQYILDIYSPLSWRRAADALIESRCDAVVISWWTIVWQPAFAYIAWRLRKHDIVTIFLCHNLFDHDGNVVQKTLSKTALQTCRHYIVHTSEEAQRIEQLIDQPEILCRPHPAYTHFPQPQKKPEKRGELELLYFGFIRPYKGVDVLVDAMKRLPKQGVHLTMVGEVWGKGAQEALENRIQNADANIETQFSYVNEATAADYFARADVVVLPYLSATGSGVVALAYHFGLPVIASAVGGLADVVRQGETGWLVEPNDPAALAATIQHVTRDSAKSMQPYIASFCRENSWESMARAIVGFIEELAPEL